MTEFTEAFCTRQNASSSRDFPRDFPISRQLFTNECNMRHFLMVNEPEYFPTGFSDPDPCSSSIDSVTSQECNKNQLYQYFRTHNGNCNNPNNPRWGATISRLERFLPRQHTKLRIPTYDSLPPPKGNTHHHMIGSISWYSKICPDFWHYSFLIAFSCFRE